MKRWMQKKWFRITMRIVVVGVSLVVLAWTWFNWQAAGRKARAIAGARAAGLPLSLEEFTANMPPPEQNFAHAGILKAWEEAQERGEDTRVVGPGSPREPYKAMGEEDFGRLFKKGSGGNDIREIDFALMPDGSSYGKTAAGFLAEYERRHGPAIAEIKKGYALPHARRAMAPAKFGGGVDFIQTSEAFGFRSSHVQRGLILRAEAALAAGDSAKAAESVELGLRLAELVGSRGFSVSVLIEFVMVRGMAQPLKSGMKGHIWKTEDLEQIQAALRRVDVRRDMQRGIQSEVLVVNTWQTWKENRDSIRGGMAVLSDFGEANDYWNWLTAKHPGTLPAGWFDLNAESLIETTIHCSGLAAKNGPVKVWMDESTRMTKDYEERSRSVRSLLVKPAASTMLRVGAETTVRVQLMLMACELEKYYLQRGSYPATLAGFPPELSGDPFDGETFRYTLDGAGFRLYSPGPDGVDDGGEIKANVSATNQKDWVW